MSSQRWLNLARVFALFVAALFVSASLVEAQVTGQIVKEAPMFLVKDATRQPLLIMEADVWVEVLRREGTWVNITVEGSQFGRRTGYVEARFIEVAPPATEVPPRVTAASVIPPKVAVPTTPVATVQSSVPSTSAAPPVALPAAREQVQRPASPAPLALSASGKPLVFIAADETLDGSNARDKAKQVDFGSSLAAALVKKKVPVTIVTDASKAHWIIKSASSQHEDSTGTKVAKIAFAGVFAGGFTKFEGTIQVIDNSTSAVLYAYNVKKGNFQSAAEAFAKHFNADYLRKR
jgi:hypothetical protein